MYVLTPVARDPGLLCVVVSAPAWRNWAARHPLPKKQLSFKLPTEPRRYTTANADLLRQGLQLLLKDWNESWTKGEQPYATEQM